MNTFDNLKINEKLILVTLFVIPFLKGLFFKENFLPIFILYIIVFLLFIIKSNSLIFDSRILFLFIIQITFGLYSAIFGINREEAMYGLLLLMFPIVVYLLMLNIINDYQDFVYISFFMLFVSGTIISIINYLMELKFNTTESLIRFTWVIPYANTLAVYLFASSIAGFYIIGERTFDIKRKVLIILGICINISALVFTYSRTMLVLAAIFYVVLFIIQKNRQIKIDYLLIFLLSGLSIVFYSIYKWKSFLIIFAICAILVYFYEKNSLRILSELKKLLIFLKKKRKLLLILIPVVVFVIFISIIVLKSTDIYKRIQTISSNNQTLLERFAYYKDSINIIKDFPIFGIGSGGWSSIMYKYQTAIYSPKYIHSSIIQITLNYGLLGLIVFLLQIMLFFIYFIKAIRNKLNYKYSSAILSLFIINLSILLHSIIDIDFEFQIINLIFWTNLVFITLLSGRILVKIHITKLVKSILILISIILVSGSILVFSANAYYLKGMKSYENKNFSLAINSFDKSIKLNPFSYSSFFMKGNALWEIFVENSEEKIFEEMEKNIDIAEKNDRFNPEYTNKEGLILFVNQNYDESVKKYEELIDLQPLKLGNYEVYSTALLKKAEQGIISGNSNQARLDFNRIIRIESQIVNLNKKLSPFASKLKHKPELTLSPELSYNVSEAYYYLQDFDKARYYADKALKDDRYIQKISELKSRFEKYK